MNELREACHLLLREATHERVEGSMPSFGDNGHATFLLIMGEDSAIDLILTLPI
jgi:hypothetical protein